MMFVSLELLIVIALQEDIQHVEHLFISAEHSNNLVQVEHFTRKFATI